MISQIIADVELNIRSMANNFQSLLKKYIKKNGRKVLQRKKDKNNYFRAEISKKEQGLLRVKVKKKIDF